ncbi:G-protein coupled receptor 39-like [Spea bombifrons]|uniref:G-protein coupled receptor 39-like n=1 Tax=Spea bombifrons TaxID=233779 RepID=UPI00234AA9D2|nr:G-protein coupled receptor 39-like [Spea bombifrons]
MTDDRWRAQDLKISCSAGYPIVEAMPPVAETSEAPIKLSTCAKSVVSLAYVLLLVAGILGNTLVLRVLHGFRSGRSVQASLRHHMCSLAACDLLQLVLGIPAELYGSIWSSFPWPLGTAGCRGFYYLWEVLCYAAILNVLSLSCERHRATCQPLSLHLRKASGVRLRLCLLWLASFLAGLPIFFSMGLEDVYEEAVKGQLLVCTPLNHWRGLFTIGVWMSFVTYLGVLLVVAVTCWRMRRALEESGTSLEVPGPGGSVQLLGRCCSGQTIAVRRQNARMLGCIVGALAVCWLPFQARRLMTVLRRKNEWTEIYYRSYITLQPITHCFYYLSSCLIPLLYNLTSRSFRRAFLHSITPCAKGPPSAPSASWHVPHREEGIRLPLTGQDTRLVGRGSTISTSTPMQSTI